MKLKTKISAAVSFLCLTQVAFAQEWLIKIDVPGIDYGVMADVVLEGTRALVTVQKYPGHMEGTLEVMSMRVSPFGTDVTPEACEQVKNRALMFTNESLPEAFRARAKQQVREATAGTIVVKPGGLTGTADFHAAVKAALTKEGIPFATFDIKNRWNVTSMQPKLVLEPGAQMHSPDLLRHMIFFVTFQPERPNCLLIFLERFQQECSHASCYLKEALSALCENCRAKMSLHSFFQD
jgi:hypothetical protein